MTYHCIHVPSYILRNVVSVTLLNYHFLARGKYHAAIEAFNVVPLDARETIVGQIDEVHRSALTKYIIVILLHNSRNFLMMYRILLKNTAAFMLTW